MDVKLPETPRAWPKEGPRRFLQDTALRLGEDARREFDGSCMSTPSTALPKSRGPSTMQQRDDEKLMRNSFLAEASDCIRSLQSVFDSANASTFVSRFEDWRKIDLRATAQLQEHVKCLQVLNESMAGFLRKSAVDDFQEFHGSMVSLSQSVHEMQDFRRAFAETVDQISEGISARVLSSLRAEADERFAWLSCQMEKQGEVHESIQITQRKIWNRLESMGATMEKEHKAAALQKQQMGQLSETQLRIQQDCQSLLELQHGVFQSFRSSSEKQGAEKENIFSSIGSEIQDLRGFVAQTLGEVGEGGFSAELRGLEQRLETWEAESLKSVAELRDELTRTELACTDRDRQVQELQRLHEDQKQRAEAVENRLETTQADLDAQLAALRDAHRASMVNSLKRLRDIESRGNIKVDRQFGRVALARALEFVPAAPPKEKGAVGGPASFGDAFEAEKVLEDFLEVVAMFDAPVQVGVGCKASKSDAAAWQDLAVKRAALIRDYLVSHGRPEDSVTVLGTAQPEVFLQLQEPNLFPPKAVKGKGKGRSASPKR